MKGLLQQFQATIERESLLPSGSKLILCVSVVLIQLHSSIFATN